MNAEHYNPNLLADARKKKFTQKELAEKLGVTEMTISRAEKGQGVSYELLLEMCNQIEIDVKTLLISNTDKIFCAAT